jgi:hypothetical protein
VRADLPELTEYVYLAAPNTDDKELLASLGEANLIDCRAGFSEQNVAKALDAFPRRKSSP